MRPHEEPGAVVLDAAVRSWAPVEPFVLRWGFPIWRPAPELDPAQLKCEKPKRRGVVKEPELPPDEQVQEFVQRFITEEPRTRPVILRMARAAGYSARQAQQLLRWAVENEAIYHWGGGRYHPSRYATVPKPHGRRQPDDNV